jgi:molecular chaperone GrpE
LEEKPQAHNGAPSGVEPPPSAPAPRVQEPLEPADALERAKERIARQAKLESEQERRQLITSFLEVLDDLDRALEAGRTGADEDALMRGVEMVRESFLAKLAQHGVLPSDELGKPFDPERHQAVTTMAVADPADLGRVVGVLRPGYTIDGELLRPAGVAVGR